MSINLGLTENISIHLGEKRDSLVSRLEANEVRYKIMYDKEDENGILETVMSISEFDIELTLVNNIVSYMRAYNSDNTNIMRAGENEEACTPAEFIRKVHAKIRGMADDIMNLRIEIEKLDMSNMKSAFIITQNENRMRIGIAKDAHGNVFMNTFKRLEVKN